MIFEAIFASIIVALASIAGVLFFGHDKRLVGKERFIVPVAVGVFLSLVLFELIPETVAVSEYGGIVVAAGFIAFYLLSALLHNHYHHKAEDEHCHRKSAAILILIGDAVHNLADGFVLGAAFLADPAIGIAVSIGLILHEVPQEIVEFGVLLRAGYTRTQAVVRNLLSASTVVVGTLIVLLVSEHAGDSVWLFTGFAAGNLLYLATSELLPRVHENLKNYKTIWHSVIAIIAGFIIMTALLEWTHSQFSEDIHGHDTEHVATQQ